MRILIGGDYAPYGRVAIAMKNGIYSYFEDYKNIRYNKDIDLSILNLECPIVLNTDCPIEKNGPNIGCSEKVIDSLQYAGVNMVTLANNHILDYGADALMRTKKLCESAGIMTVGIGENIQKANEIRYLVIRNKIVAVINCCEHEYSIATRQTPGANPINPISQYYAIKNAQQKASFIIVLVHGGHEEFQLPSVRMKETYRFFIDAGADLVVNAHQHCFSGYEIYKHKLIFYGIGNLCFDEENKIISPWNQGFLVLVDTDKYLSSKNYYFEIIPYEQATPEYYGIRILSPNTYDNMIQYLNEIITNDLELETQLDQYYKQSYNSIRQIFSPYTNRFTKALCARNLIPSFISKKRKIRIQNYLNCESHFDKIKFFINQK